MTVAMGEVGPVRLCDLATEIGVHNRTVAKRVRDLGYSHGAYGDELASRVVVAVRESFGYDQLKGKTTAAQPVTRLEIDDRGTFRSKHKQNRSAGVSVQVEGRPLPVAGSASRASTQELEANPTARDVEQPSANMTQRTVITLQGSHQDYPDLLSALKTARRNDAGLAVDLSRISRQWPNWIAPIAAVIQYFRSQGVSVAVTGEQMGISKSFLRNPLQATQENVDRLGVQNIVWAYFDEREALVLTNELISLIQRSVQLGEGVQHSLKFCLFEILDNVFQHSEAECGYLMATLQSQSARLSVTVADTGVGVFNSFVPSKYKPPSHFDALTLAIQEGITSTGDRRGNGLFALQRTVQQNQGRLELKSGYGYLLIANYGTTGRDVPSRPVIDDRHHGLIIDWQIDLRHPVNLDEALGMTTVNDDLERFEDEIGNYVICIADHDAGTGSRRAAEELRNYLSNILKLGAGHLVLDFTSVEVVSASFADEVIGKLAEELGPIEFFARYSITNASALIKQLLDRAIRLRLSRETPEAITRSSVSDGRKRGK